MTDAVVVGSGPNGLAAGVTLARSGLEVLVLEAAEGIGGGTRSVELGAPGVLHDVCSAVHPLGAVSPFFNALDLGRHGLEWLRGELDLAHPLDGGRVAVMTRSMDETVAAMAGDASPWRRTFGPLSDTVEDLGHDVLGPLVRVPHHPLLLARFGIGALQSASLFARRFSTNEVRGLYAGIAAHSLRPFSRAATAAAASVLVGAGHHSGWPVARGGSRAIADALVSELESHGGKVRTGVQVGSLEDMEPNRVVLLDVAPDAALRIVGDRMPHHVQRSFRRWRHGPGAHKVDFVVRGDIPWADAASGRAVTVHCGGTLEEIASVELDVHSGRMPERPFVLVSQQYLADPSRSGGEFNPIWAYAHVPHGYTGDATEAVLAQIERFAPGFRDIVTSVHSRTPADLQRYNPNYVGGDIATGANSARQMVFRPRVALDPYRIGSGVFLCSAATPPGAGVHGMCGWHAARSALSYLGMGAPTL